jgi:hypothetical protein
MKTFFIETFLLLKNSPNSSFSYLEEMVKVVTGDDEAADPPKLSSSSSFRAFNFLAEEIVVFSMFLKTSFSNIFGVVDSIDEDAVEDVAVAIVVVAKELFVVVGFGVVIGTLRDVAVVDKTVGLAAIGSIFSVTKIGFLRSSFLSSTLS